MTTSKSHHVAAARSAQSAPAHANNHGKQIFRANLAQRGRVTIVPPPR